MPTPHIVLAGGGAAGLWCALALAEAGWPGERVTVVEPDLKLADDHTWGYWATTPLVPPDIHFAACPRVVLREGGRELITPAAPYRYYCLRSSRFYAYAKRRLREAGVRWVADAVSGFRESGTGVDVALGSGTELRADYALDSRPLDCSTLDPDANTTLQHFGGCYVVAEVDCFDPEEAVLMDFAAAVDGEVAFFYVVPASRREALVELAVLSLRPWRRERYDGRLNDYLRERYPHAAFQVREREYGVIPMTDAALWRASTPRVWAVGTRGGWVQPSSGYAFTRTARFAHQTAALLALREPRSWRPSAVQEVFNATMLRYVNEHPARAGAVFFDLFARNGAPRTLAFLDESAGVADTLALMNNSPRKAFTRLALAEAGARIVGTRR